ncbi:MAG: BON domain-containing protein [Chloroflexota bacterium]
MSLETPESKLVDAVTEALRHHESTAAARVEVTAQGQQVWLQGEVASQAVKDEAESVAKHIQGVAMVVNELTVRPEGGRGDDDLNPTGKTPPGTTFPLTTH